MLTIALLIVTVTVAAAYNEEWMPHAIVLAILSMVSGTTWGLLTILLFRWMGG
ncbi:hypothetical protein [Lewinella cohaerens]|uniref:hypothetical protein n=1 Tax=Lewinella cohaerens TaxID=70995 RepID=UPI00036FBBB9|nr:hypothetical protein [Lewinella cohaerens]